MPKANKREAEMPMTREALDLFTVKRKQGKPTGQYESHGIKYGNVSLKKRKNMAMEYVAPGSGGWGGEGPR